jgi:hypothetical protein
MDWLLSGTQALAFWALFAFMTWASVQERKQGIGTQLVSTVEQELSQRGHGILIADRAGAQIMAAGV